MDESFENIPVNGENSFGLISRFVRLYQFHATRPVGI
jgi:hypothetical protein